MAWGNIGGGFATGLQAGSQTVARAMQAERDRENQEYVKSEREREAQIRGEYETAGAQAETTQQQGLRVTGPEEGAKPFYIPADAADAAKAYAAQGYTVGEAPTSYSQTQVKGGKTLRQSEISPEHAEMGYDPNRGLQEQYNAPTARNQRLLDVAVRRGKFADAAALSGLTTNELQQTLTKAKIEDIPQEREARDVTIRTGKATLTKAERENERNRIEDEAFAASRTPEGALKYFNDRDPDDGPVEIVPTKDGRQQFVQTNKDGTKTVIGKAFSTWDEGRAAVLGGIPKYAETMFTKGIEQENEMARIAERGKWQLKNTAAMKADKKINWEPGQKAEYSNLETQIADAVEKGDYNKISQLSVRMEVLTNKVLMANNRAPQRLNVPQRRDTTWTDVKAFQDAQKDFIETYRTPEGKGFHSLSPEDQDEVLGKKGLLHGPTVRGGGGGSGDQSGGSKIVSGPRGASNQDSGPAGGSKETKPARGRPQMPPETNVPREATQLDAAKQDMRAAEAKLRAFGSIERQRNPEGYATAQALVRAAQEQLRAAEAHWEDVAPNAAAITGLQPRPR